MSESDMPGRCICGVDIDRKEDFTALIFDCFRFLVIRLEDVGGGEVSCTAYASLTSAELDVARFSEVASSFGPLSEVKVSPRMRWYAI